MTDPLDAWGPVSALLNSSNNAIQDTRTMVKALRTVLDEELWREFVFMGTGEIKSFATFTEFLVWGERTPEELLAVLRARGEHDLVNRVIDMLAPAARDAKGGPIPANVSDTNVRDNDSLAIVARLKRDDPDLAQAIIAGAITPNAAAIKAGIRHRYARVRTDDVQRAVDVLLMHYDAAEITAAASASAAPGRARKGRAGLPYPSLQDDTQRSTHKAAAGGAA